MATARRSVLKATTNFFGSEKHRTKMHIGLVGLVVVTLGVLAWINNLNPTVVNAQQGNDVVATPNAIASSNEVLIKIKPNALSNLTNRLLNVAGTGLPLIDQVLGSFPGTKAIPIVKTNNVSHPLAAWYKVELPVKPNETQLQMGTSLDRLKPGKLAPIAQAVPLFALDTVTQALQKTGLVDKVEKNYQMQASLVPNDPYYTSTGSWGQSFDDLWGLKKINAVNAWDGTTGSSNVVVADIDTGVDRNHPDISDNMWVNTKEIPNNGIDDDKNGYVDDYYGWDWVNNDNDPIDDHGHGTHTAGTIAAKGNNGAGVVGVNWNAKVMALKFLDRAGSGYMVNAAAAITYAADNGAKVTSNSWGCECTSQLIEDAMRYAHDKGVINVVAAGNTANDAINTSPANSDGVVTVGSINSAGTRSGFSNYGPKVDVVAPGEDILSLKAAGGTMCYASITVGNSYCYVSGTSMATPHVAGLAALALSKQPGMNPEQLRQLIRTKSKDLGTAGYDTNYGYGLIDAGATIANTGTLPPLVYIDSPKSRTDISGSSQVEITGVAGGPGFASYKVEIGSGGDPTTWQQLSNSTQAVTTTGRLATFNPTSGFSDGSYTVRLTVTTTDGKTYEYRIFSLKIDYLDVDLTSPQMALSRGARDLVGTVRAKNGKTLKNYTIEYGLGDSPTSYSTTGVTLAGGGTQPVSAGILGNLNNPGLINKQKYTIRLSASTTDSTVQSNLYTVVVDYDLVPGWPKTVASWPCTSVQTYCEIMPAVGNIDSDPDLEIVVGKHPNQLTAYKRDGSEVPGWPFTAPNSNEFFGRAPVIADIDGDGKAEVLIISSTLNYSGGNLYILKANGQPYPGWTAKPITSSWIEGENEDLAPSIADLNGDGKLEIVVWETDRGLETLPIRLHAFTPTGSEIAGFPKAITKPTLAVGWYNQTSAPVVADLNGDGKLEIVTHYNNLVYVYDNTGNLLPGWPKTAGNDKGGITANAVADLDGDGKLEIVARSDRDQYVSPNTVKLYAWDRSGNPLANWPQTSDSQGSIVSGANKNLVVFDTNNDGKDEVVLPADDGISIHGIGGKQSVAAANGQYRTCPTTPTPAQFSPGGNPAVASNYSNPQLPTFQHELLSLDGANLWTSADYARSNFSSCIQNTPLIGDFNNNQQLEILATRSYVRPSITADLFLWEVPGNKTWPADSWLSSGHDVRHTQRFTRGQTPDTTPPSVTLSQPANGSSIAGDNNTTFQATASDDRTNVGKVEFIVDGQVVCTVTAAPFSCSWHSPDTGVNLNRTVQAKAYDLAGNSAIAQASVTVTPNADTVAPNVTVTQPIGGSSVAGDSDVQLTADATDNRAVTMVDFLVDGVVACHASSAPFACTWHVPDTATTHSSNFQAKAYDAASNSKTSASVSATINSNQDVAAPSIMLSSPTNGSSIPGDSNTSFQATASDNRAISKVEFIVDGQLVCMDTTTPFTCSWHAPDTGDNLTRVIRAKAYDAANNVASASSTVTITANTDTAYPVATLTQPTNGSSLNGDSDMLFTANATDNRGVTMVDFLVDGVAVCRDSTAPYSCAWHVPDTAATHNSTFQARAYDAASNSFLSVGSVVSIKANPDTAAPTVALAQPAAGSSVTGDSDVALAATVSDNRAVTMVDFLVDGAVVCRDSVTPFTCSWHAPDTATTHMSNLQAVAYDAASNSTTSAGNAVTVNANPDTVAPTASLTQPTTSTSITSNTDISLAASANDNRGVTMVDFLVDGAVVCRDSTAPFACTWHVPDSALTRASSFQARAYDAASNTTTSAAVSVTVKASPDLTAPTVQMTAPASGSTVKVSKATTITANASDNRAVAKVEFYVNNKLTCTDTAAPYSCAWSVPFGLGGTTYSLTAKSYDAANNTALTPAVSVKSSL